MTSDKISAALQKQYANIEDRLQNPTDSTTSKLLHDPNALIKKFGEEYAELIAALAQGNAENYLEEMQQAAGWLSMVGAVSLGICAEDYFNALTQERR